MEHAVSTLLAVWIGIILITFWIVANALADFGARRLRQWFQSSRRPRS